MHHSVILWNSPTMHSVNKSNTAFFNVLTYLLNKQAIMYLRWNTALLADLICTCGQHVLFRNIFVCFCLHLCIHTNHDNLNFFPYQQTYSSQYFRFLILVSMPSTINPNIEH